MKTTNHITKRARSSALALASILVVGLLASGSASAQYKATGNDGITASPKLRAQLEERTPIATPAMTSTATMACAKCTDGWIRVSDSTVKGAGARALIGQTNGLVAKHLCEGCGAEWNVAGAGKAKQVVASHKCTACGAENLACCSGKGTGTMATKGMDQKVQIAPLK